mmetsp:Transcript_41558/g.87191  ORF Transcript_41558/g.87191 Transcript_41558/m.87191 type:complete len:109 (+) Transcript_41558:228-554(+)
MLAEQYPTSKTSVDKRKRTPLHFALGHTDRPANVATVVLLSGTGAALMADENGMLVSFFDIWGLFDGGGFVDTLCILPPPACVDHGCAHDMSRIATDFGRDFRYQLLL